MWKYEKKLEYPINITKKDLNLAKSMMAQYGGPYLKRDKLFFPHKKRTSTKLVFLALVLL